MTDLHLGRLKAGDQSEFRKLVNAYQQPLYFFVFKILKDHDDVDDVLQETLIRAYKYINNFRGDASLKTWLFQIASNTALTALKKRQTAQKQELLEQTEHLAAPDQVDEQILHQQFHTAVQKSLEYLTPTQQLVFRLRHLNGMSTREAADVMNCSQNNVKKQLFTAMNRIRRYLKRHYPEYQINEG